MLGWQPVLGSVIVAGANGRFLTVVDLGKRMVDVSRDLSNWGGAALGSFDQTGAHSLFAVPRCQP